MLFLTGLTNPSFFKTLAALALWLAMAAGGQAAEARVFLNRFWQTSEGMPSNVVYDTAKDREGFLWIATGAGIARFDGLRFEVFTTLDGLPDTQIYCLQIDQKGRVWIGTRRGAAYRENGIWHPVLTASPVFSLGEAADGAIWLGTYSGCLRWTGGEPTKIDLGTMIPDTRSFLRDGDDGMWILTQGNLCLWRPAGTVEVLGPWVGKDLRDITRDHQGRLIICGTGVLLRRDGDGWEDLTRFIPGGGNNANLSCAVAPDDTLWLATRNRGLTFLKGSETGSVNVTKGLSLDDARSVMIDEDGMIWAGTNGGGINSLRRRIFDTYSTREGLGRTVTSALVVANDGTVLAGSDGSGIFRKNGGRFIPHAQNLGLPQTGLIWSLCAHSDGSLWVGTYRDGLFRIFDDHVERIPLPLGATRNAISALYQTRDGGLLIGTHNEGVWKWRDGQFDPSIRGLASPTKNDVYLVYDMLEDRQGHIWVAMGTQGLWRFKDGSWKEMAHAAEMPELLATVFHESPNGDLWIGSLGQGLTRYRDNHFSAWTTTDGLISNTVCQILEDDIGHLWLGTDRGLQRVSVQALDSYQPGKRRLPLESLRFSRDDGLPTPQFSAEHGNLSARAKDGSLWFSLASGAVRVDPLQVSTSKALPTAWIKSAAADKGPIWTADGPQTTDRIVVEPGAGTLTIRFTAPTFIAPERTRFRFRMAGLENEWQEVEGTRVASYASLPPRSYQFEVMTATADGIWNPRPTRVEVVVKPFIWQTLGFRIFLYLATLAATALLIWTWSLRRIRRRLAFVVHERRLEKERARIARDLHDDLGATLTEINFLGTLTADAVTDSTVRARVEGIVERAQRMAKSLDEIVWTVNPANDSLSSTANYLCSRSQESLATAGIRCRQNIADVLPNVTVDSELRHHLLMAVNEAVNNVMKHSGATECTLSIQTDHATLRISVADNGCGFTPVNVPSGRNGLINLQRRMESSGGSAAIDSNTHGTTVMLQVPLP